MIIKSPNPLGTSSRFQLVGNDVLDGENPVGHWFPEQSRIEWLWTALGADQTLIDMLRTESALWDKWADSELRIESPLSSDQLRFSLSGWQKRYPDIRHVLDAVGIDLDLTGKKILDVGGSGKDMAYWLRALPARIDQVEVSPRSQFLCKSRVKNCLGPNTEIVPIYYHTIPAEKLPFDDSSFDFVFSRATIHHCKRPDVFSQIVRVTKPGGILLFVEPHLSDTMHWLMRTRRRLLRRDRGTDDPLRFFEMKHLEDLLCGSQTASTNFYSGNLLRLLRFNRQNEDWASTPRQLAIRVTFAGRKADAAIA